MLILSLSFRVYNLFIRLLYLLILIHSYFNAKSRNWIRGRKEDEKRLLRINFNPYKIAWFHCASLGEFEQGLPLMQKMKKADFKIFVSFFSPSGYNKISKTDLVDFVFYLPLDTKSKTKYIIDIVKPKMVFIVKYEYWYNFLYNVKKQNIPLILYSAIFLKRQIFFKKYGYLHRHLLSFFSIIYVQNISSKQLINTLNRNILCEVTGDTRFDRVLENASYPKPILPWLNNFKANKEILVVGSSWKEDINLLHGAVPYIPNIKTIITPHEVNTNNINFIKHKFKNSICLSEIKDLQKINGYDFIIIDTIGLLSHLYYYADYVYVGGGFNKSGIHNILEPAVFGKPIFIGPHYKKFNEASTLIKLKGVMSVKYNYELIQQLTAIQKHETQKESVKAVNKSYVKINGKVADNIMLSLYENRFLTN